MYGGVGGGTSRDVPLSRLELQSMEQKHIGNLSRLKSYNLWWLGFWFAGVATVLSALSNSPLAPIAAVVALPCALATMFWACPNCKHRVGVESYGTFWVALPGCRRCLHCRTLLVSFQK